MSTSVHVCRLDEALREELKVFRKHRRSDVTSGLDRALVMKIDPDRMEVVLEKRLDGLESVDELRDELPDRQPRFVSYSTRLTHRQDGDDDVDGAGRVSYPVCLIFYTPDGCKTEQMVMYAGTKLHLVKESEIHKVFEVTDLDELTQGWLREQLLLRR